MAMQLPQDQCPAMCCKRGGPYVGGDCKEQCNVDLVTNSVLLHM